MHLICQRNILILFVLRSPSDPLSPKDSSDQLCNRLLPAAILSLDYIWGNNMSGAIFDLYELLSGFNADNRSKA